MMSFSQLTNIRPFLFRQDFRLDIMAYLPIRLILILDQLLTKNAINKKTIFVLFPSAAFAREITEPLKKKKSMICMKMCCINGCMVITNLVISLVPQLIYEDVELKIAKPSSENVNNNNSERNVSNTIAGSSIFPPQKMLERLEEVMLKVRKFQNENMKSSH